MRAGAGRTVTGAATFSRAASSSISAMVRSVAAAEAKSLGLRAAPPAAHPLIVNERERGISPFVFAT